MRMCVCSHQNSHKTQQWQALEGQTEADAPDEGGGKRGQWVLYSKKHVEQRTQNC